MYYYIQGCVNIKFIRSFSIFYLFIFLIFHSCMRKYMQQCTGGGDKYTCQREQQQGRERERERWSVGGFHYFPTDLPQALSVFHQLVASAPSQCHHISPVPPGLLVPLLLPDASCILSPSFPDHLRENLTIIYLFLYGWSIHCYIHPSVHP